MEYFSFLKTKQHAHKPNIMRGFTLIEMIVVMAIIVILTAVILSGQTLFSRTLLLTDTSYTVGLSFRQAQTLGLSSQKALGVQNAAIGLHFTTGNPNAYYEFADISPGTSIPSWCPTGSSGTPTAKPGNCLYDGASELLHTYSFTQGFTQQFCAYAQLAGVETLLGCSNSVGITQLQSMDVVFQRPNTNTVMTAVFTNGSYVQPDLACIKVLSTTGTYRYVRVTQLGEVSINATCP